MRIGLLMALVLFVPQVCGAQTTVWNFNNPANRFDASSGPAELDYYDPFLTDWGPAGTLFGTASGFGLPPLPGGDANVMAFPGTTSEEGYELFHNAFGNGSGTNEFGTIGNYTLVFDVLFPVSSDGRWRALLQTDPFNGSDGEFFINPGNGIGISGNYVGQIKPDTWHRIGITVRAADNEGQWVRYIDGQFVGAQGTTGSAIDQRFVLDPTSLLLFADENNETAPGFVSSIMFADRQLTIEEMQALGRPTALGADRPGAVPAPLEKLSTGVTHIIGHRGRSGSAPENTIASINAAFDAGATAIEVDIRTSADGIAVLMHDDLVDRTTNGFGFVSDMTVAELKTLNAGAWFDPDFAGETVPTLAEALVAAHGRGRMLLDIKESGMGEVINQALIDASALLGEPIDATAIWPWSGGSIEKAIDFQDNIPNVETVHGAPPDTLDQAGFDELKSLGIVGFDVGGANKTFIDAAHDNGMFITLFTILTPDQMRQAVAQGFDGMETDFPGVLKSISSVAGDADGDGNVTVDDYFVIRDHFFEQDVLRSEGDLTGNRLVDFDDFLEWSNAFPGGPAAAAEAISSVPEPSTWLLLISALPIAVWFRRRRNA